MRSAINTFREISHWPFQSRQEIHTGKGTDVFENDPTATFHAVLPQLTERRSLPLTSMRSRPQTLAAAAIVSFALLASACGSGSESSANIAAPAGSDSDAAPVDAGSDPASVAAANIDNLATSDDVRLIELLDVDSGEATTISDAVDGDRPVLLWFWAPN